MAKEITTARERTAKGLRSQNAINERTRTRAAKIPKGKELNYDDDIVTVYDENGKKVSEGMWDYSPYRTDETYETMKWDDTAKNYKLPNGYRIVVKK